LICFSVKAGYSIYGSPITHFGDDSTSQSTTDRFAFICFCVDERAGATYPGAHIYRLKGTVLFTRPAFHAAFPMRDKDHPGRIRLKHPVRAHLRASSAPFAF
jgi:hypothetical protein